YRRYLARRAPPTRNTRKAARRKGLSVETATLGSNARPPQGQASRYHGLRSREGLLDISALDSKVGYPANSATFVEAEDPLLCKTANESIEVPPLDGKVNEIRLRWRRQFDSGHLGEPFRRDAGVVVVLGEAVDHVLQSMNARGCNDSGLAHPAAE